MKAKKVTKDMEGEKVIELIDLSDWKKQKQIIFELHREYGINISRDGREWRNAVNKWNAKWRYGEVPFYITHSNKLGYKATTDYNEAKIGRNDYLLRLKANRENILNCDEGFEKKFNLKIDFESGELI